MEEREEERGSRIVTRSHSDLNTCGCWRGRRGGGGGGGGGGKEGRGRKRKRKLNQFHSRSVIEHITGLCARSSPV